jgi:hypothetical protein
MLHLMERASFCSSREVWQLNYGRPKQLLLVSVVYLPRFWELPLGSGRTLVY